MRTVALATDLSLWLALRAGRRRVQAAAVDRDVPVRVRRVRRPCADVVTLDLGTAGDAGVPAWRPGAHVDLVLPSGRIRQYSLCGDPRDDAYRIAVRLVGDGSREVHGLGVGDDLVVRGPRNAFPLAAAPTYLFLAGGIGITPIAPMVRAAAAAGADWRLVHTGRSLDSMPLSDELAARYPDRVSRRPDDGGAPPDAATLLGALPTGCAVYCCGPPPMTDAVRAVTPAGHRFHSERFSPPPIRDGRPFTIGVAGGPDLAVPADRTALDVLREAYPHVGWSCRQGFCGTCHVQLRAGTTVGDPAPPGSTAVCVARAVGERIEIDLGFSSGNP